MSYGAVRLFAIATFVPLLLEILAGVGSTRMSGISAIRYFVVALPSLAR
jgi:hypothetical protein